MIKKVSLAIGLMACLILSACSFETSKSFTFSVETGDNIKVELRTSDGYDMDSNVPFTVTKDGEDVARGTFLYGSSYEEYRTAYESTEDATLLDEGEKDGNSYYAYSLPEEIDYFVYVADSDTVVVIASINGDEAAADVFNALTFTCE